MTVTASAGAVDYTRIRREIGRTFFSKPDPDDWTTFQSQQATDAIDDAVRMVKTPPIIPMFGPKVHRWTWLQPFHTFKTAADQREYTLPVHFESFITSLFFDSADYAYEPIEYVPAMRLHAMDNLSDSTSVPRFYSTETKAHTGVSEQRRKLVLHPTPDGTYPLSGQYQIGVFTISATKPYPPGGPEHGELWIAACLAAMEMKIDNNPAGPRNMKFKEVLASHISADLRKRPVKLGYMGNGKMRGPRSRSQARRTMDLVSGYTTYNSDTNL